MDLGRYEVQKQLDPAAFRNVPRRQAPIRLEIGQVLNNRRTFNDDLSVIEHKNRDVAVWIDREEVLAVAGLVRTSFNVDDVNVEFEFSSNDVRRQGTGRLANIELHGFLRANLRRAVPTARLLCILAYNMDSVNFFMRDRIQMAKRGRPIEYDREQTIHRASDLFWSAGFAATSLDSLSEATQMTRPSLAGAFGDKEALYIATLERYRDASADAISKILSGARRLRTELADLFAKSTDAYLAPMGAARGCLLIGTASVEAVHRPAVRRVLRESLDTFNAILEERLRRAIAEGELDSDANAAGLASVASAVMHSLAVRARAGESRRALDRLSKSALDLICGKQAKRRT